MYTKTPISSPLKRHIFVASPSNLKQMPGDLSTFNPFTLDVGNPSLPDEDIEVNGPKKSHMSGACAWSNQCRWFRNHG